MLKQWNFNLQFVVVVYLQAHGMIVDGFRLIRRQQESIKNCWWQFFAVAIFVIFAIRFCSLLRLHSLSTFRLRQMQSLRCQHERKMPAFSNYPASKPAVQPSQQSSIGVGLEPLEAFQLTTVTNPHEERQIATQPQYHSWSLGNRAKLFTCIISNCNKFMAKI